MSAAEVYDFGAGQATDRFAEWVENAVNGADYLRDALAGNGAASLPELAHLLAAIRDAQSKLATLQRECEANLADAVKASGEREPEVPGVGVLKVRHSSRTEWDSSRLFATTLGLAANRVLERGIDPDGSQQAHLPTVNEMEQAMLDVLGACLPLTKSLGWRTGGLRECGLDPDEYRATESTGWRVQITGGPS